LKKALKTKKKNVPEKKTEVNVLDFFNSAFLIIDSKSKIRLLNNNFTDISGYKMNDINDILLEKIFKTHYLNDLFVIENKTLDGDGTILSKGGEKIEVTFHAGAIKNYEGNEKFFVIHFTLSPKFKKHINALNAAKDILKEKINEKDKELKLTNKYLEKTNEELARAEKTLTIINKEMSVEEEKKSKYIKELINQYKKPLEYISKVSDILLSESAISEEARQQFIVNLENKAKSLQNSINFLYERENEKIRGASSKIEEVDAGDFINEIEYYLEGKLNGKILRFDFGKDASYKILIDKRMLKDILIEILKNAINCLLSDRISIRIFPNKQCDRLIFNIINSGMGTPDEYQLKLFDKYSYLREINFSPMELNFPVFNDILSSFDARIDIVKQKNKEDIVKIEVKLASEIKKEPAPAKEEAPAQKKEVEKKEILVKKKIPVVKKRKRKIK